MIERIFQGVDSADKTEALEHIISLSSPNRDFFLMVVLSILMATFGLLSDSSAVIVGSMLIAPVLYPILSLALGIVISDFKIIERSLTTLFKSGILAVFGAMIVTLLFTAGSKEYTDEILARAQPSLLYAAIGMVAGFAASFAMTKPKLNETLPGVAISVAIVPPLAVVGIGIARLDLSLALNSFLLFAVNIFGVIVMSMIVFALMNFYPKRMEAARVVAADEKILEEERQNNEISKA